VGIFVLMNPEGVQPYLTRDAAHGISEQHINNKLSIKVERRLMAEWLPDKK
jgi:hypothetical protein